MKLKFIADIHISPLTVKALQNKGYDIVRITDKLPATSSDAEIVQLRKLPVIEGKQQDKE